MTDYDPASIRQMVYRLLIALTIGVSLAKVFSAESVVEPSRYKPPTPEAYGSKHPDPSVRTWPAVRPSPTPMFGSNDRSRFATIRALVENQTYIVGRRIDNPAMEPGSALGSVAGFAAHRTKVAKDIPAAKLDTGLIFEDGYQSLDKVMNPETGEFYSSKPPLMPTVLAGEYWVLYHAFGLRMDDDRWPVAGIILITVNVIPFFLFLVFFARLLEDYGTTNFGRLFVFATACFGTFLTTFTITLNNHNPAAFAVFFSFYPLLKKAGPSALDSPLKLIQSGFFAGLATTLDLPAAAHAMAIFVPMLIVRPGKTGLFFAPALMLPIIALFLCNYASMGRFTPAYSEFGGPWYNYEGSHWSRLGTPGQKGLDFANDPKWVYAFNLALGHHGWFSLTPVWFLAVGSLVGLAWAGRRDAFGVLKRKPVDERLWSLPLFSAMTVVVSLVLFGFFVVQTNNYGGGTSGPRWLFWLTPLWLVGLLPAADRIGRTKWGQRAACTLLAASVLSVFFPSISPWRHPWIMYFGEYYGWYDYGL